MPKFYAGSVNVPQFGMKHRDHLCALTNGSCHGLNRARTDVTNRKDAFWAGLKWPVAPADIGTGQHKSFMIKRYAGSVEPIRVRIRSDEEEQVADRPPYFFTGCALPPTARWIS